jgi:hypothetical protein
VPDENPRSFAFRPEIPDPIPTAAKLVSFVGEAQAVQRCKSSHLPLNHVVEVLSDESRCGNDNHCDFATLSTSAQSQTEIDGGFWSTSLFKQNSERGALIKPQLSREPSMIGRVLEGCPNILRFEPSYQHLITIDRTSA